MMSESDVRQLLVLGAALYSKEFRSQLRPQDFEDATYASVLREMQEVDAGANKADALRQLPAFMDKIGVQAGDGKLIDALLAQVRLSGRWSQMAVLAKQVQFTASRTPERLDELIQRFKDV